MSKGIFKFVQINMKHLLYLCLPQHYYSYVGPLLLTPAPNVNPQIVKPYIDYKVSVIFFVLNLLSAFMSAENIYTRYILFKY